MGMSDFGALVTGRWTGFGSCPSTPLKCTNNRRAIFRRRRRTLCNARWVDAVRGSPSTGASRSVGLLVSVNALYYLPSPAVLLIACRWGAGTTGRLVSSVVIQLR